MSTNVAQPCCTNWAQPLGYFTTIIRVFLNILKALQRLGGRLKRKNFQTADDLRSQIETAGFVVEDTPDGYRVRAN